MKTTTAASLLGKTRGQMVRHAKGGRLISNGKPRPEYRVHRGSIALMLLDIWFRDESRRGSASLMHCPREFATARFSLQDVVRAIQQIIPKPVRLKALRKRSREHKAKITPDARRRNPLLEDDTQIAVGLNKDGKVILRSYLDEMRRSG